jgi:uncharacterized membrane protein
VLGLTEADVVKRAAEYTTAGQLRAVLHPGSAATGTVADTVHALAAEDSQHSPLYYVLAHGWVKLFGDSVLAFRLLSVVLSLIALPCMYWLCRELFASVGAAWLGTALLAISPFSVLYAQEAREYALWATAVIVMSAAFVRATRRGAVSDWAAYAVAFAVALYAYPVSGFLALGNLAIVMAPGVVTGVRQRAAALAASVAGILLFAPWLILLARSGDVITRSLRTTTNARHSAAYVIRTFLGLFRLDFIDLNLLHRSALNFALLVPVIALVAYVIVVVARSHDRRARYFILGTLICSAVPFVVPDLLGSGNRTFNARYFTPMYMALELGLVAVLWPNLARSSRPTVRAIWATLFAAVLVARIVSLSVSSQSDTWWSKYNERSIDVAAALNAANRPVVLTDNYVEFLLSISNYARGDIAVALRPRCYLCSLPDEAFAGGDVGKLAGRGTDVFLLGPSAPLQNAVQTAMRAAGTQAHYHCIDVRGNCAGPLHLW